MTFLSKLGSIIAKASAIFLGFAPAFQQLFPNSTGVISVVSKDLAEVATIVTNVEAFGQLQGLTGAQKAAAAGPLVAQILLNSTLLAGKKIDDPVKFNAACVTIAGGVADALNSIHADSTDTVVKK